MLVGFIVCSVFLRGQMLPSLLIILSYILPFSHEASSSCLLPQVTPFLFFL